MYVDTVLSKCSIFKLLCSLVMAAPGDLHLICQRELHYNNTMTVGMSWTLENSSEVMVAIESFNVNIRLATIDPQMEVTPITSSQVPMKVAFKITKV